MKELYGYDKIRDFTYTCWCQSRDVVKYYANETDGVANIYGFCQWHDPSSHPCYASAGLEEVDIGVWMLVCTVCQSKLVDMFEHAKENDKADAPEPMKIISAANCTCGHCEQTMDMGNGVVMNGNFVHDPEAAKQAGKALGIPAGNIVFVGPSDDEETPQ